VSISTPKHFANVVERQMETTPQPSHILFTHERHLEMYKEYEMGAARELVAANWLPKKTEKFISASAKPSTYYNSIGLLLDLID